MATLTLKKPAKHPSKPPGYYKTSSPEYKEANQWLRSILPKRPFAIGILDQILKIKPDHIDIELIVLLVRNKTHSRKYLSSFKTAKFRTDLDGKQTPIVQKHRDHALSRLNMLNDKAN